MLSSLAILAFTACGTGNDPALPLPINFEDGSSLRTTNSAPDWVYGGASTAIRGLGRNGVKPPAGSSISETLNIQTPEIWGL